MKPYHDWYYFGSCFNNETICHSDNIINVIMNYRACSNDIDRYRGLKIIISKLFQNFKIDYNFFYYHHFLLSYNLFHSTKCLVSVHHPRGRRRSEKKIFARRGLSNHSIFNGRGSSAVIRSSTRMRPPQHAKSQNSVLGNAQFYTVGEWH